MGKAPCSRWKKNNLRRLWDQLVLYASDDDIGLHHRVFEAKLLRRAMNELVEQKANLQSAQLGRLKARDPMVVATVRRAANVKLPATSVCLVAGCSAQT